MEDLQAYRLIDQMYINKATVLVHRVSDSAAVTWCDKEFPGNFAWNFTQSLLETHAVFSKIQVKFLDN
jgi:hypothetical protein